MLFNLKIGDTRFKLVISAEESPPSEFSIKYIPRENDEFLEKDALVKLSDFSGVLHISREVVTSKSDEKISDAESNENSEEQPINLRASNTSFVKSFFHENSTDTIATKNTKQNSIVSNTKSNLSINSNLHASSSGIDDSYSELDQIEKEMLNETLEEKTNDASLSSIYDDEHEKKSQLLLSTNNIEAKHDAIEDLDIVKENNKNNTEIMIGSRGNMIRNGENNERLSSLNSKGIDSQALTSYESKIVDSSRPKSILRKNNARTNRVSFVNSVPSNIFLDEYEKASLGDSLSEKGSINMNQISSMLKIKKRFARVREKAGKKSVEAVAAASKMKNTKKAANMDNDSLTESDNKYTTKSILRMKRKLAKSKRARKRQQTTSNSNLTNTNGAIKTLKRGSATQQKRDSFTSHHYKDEESSSSSVQFTSRRRKSEAKSWLDEKKSFRNSIGASSFYSNIDSEEDSSDGALDNILKKVTAKTKTFRRKTRLHALCGEKRAKIKELRKILALNPAYASYQDQLGKLPLHYIARNEHLYRYKRKAVHEFVKELIQAFPSAIFAKDDLSQLPFVATLVTWTEKANANSESSKSLGGGRVSSYIEYSKSHDVRLGNEVDVPLIVDWSFRMLSHFIHISSRYAAKNGRNWSQSQSTFISISEEQQIIDNFCSIQDILKTALCVGDDAIRYRLFDMPIFQRSILNPQLVGDWLIAMLRSDIMCTRAIDYFEMISNISIYNALDIKTKPRHGEKQKFFEAQERIFHHISKIDGLLASLFVLDRTELSRACSTSAIQRILNLLMINPSLMSSMIFTFSMHILLLLAYSMHLCYMYSVDSSDVSNTPFWRKSPWLLITWICGYFISRDDLSALFMVGSMLQFCKRYFNFWVFLESISIYFVLGTIIYSIIHEQPANSAIEAITKGLIWLRLFSYMKGVNIKLATFVLALTNIFLNLRWFLIVLLIVCLTFADTIQHLFLNTELCMDIEITDRTKLGDYCSHNLWRSLVRTYSIIAGDIELDIIYRETPAITMMWVLFTLLGLIMLLNVLIAIVTDSYEKSFIERNQIFGQARVPLLANHEFIEKKARKIVINKDKSYGFHKIFMVITLLVSVAVFEISLVSFLSLFISPPSWWQDRTNIMTLAIVSLIVAIVTNVSLLVVIKELFQWKISCKSNYAALEFLRETVSKTVLTTVYHIFGLRLRKKNMFETETEKLEGWINFIVYRTEEVVENSINRILTEVRELQLSTEGHHDDNDSFQESFAARSFYENSISSELN